jgi:hypothetical protein
MNTNTQTNSATEVDIDDILDGTLDDLADLPSIERWATGSYVAKFTFETKKIKTKNGNSPTVQINLEHVETIEVAEGEIPPVPGDKTSVSYMLDNEYGQGKFKLLMKDLAEGLNMQGAKNGAILEQADGMEVQVTVTKRQRKKDGKPVPDMFDNDIQAIVIG